MPSKPFIHSMPVLVALILIAAIALPSTLLPRVPAAGHWVEAAPPLAATDRVVPASIATEQTLYAVADTWVNQAGPGTNYGTAVWMSLGRVAGADQRILLNFDLSSIVGGSTVNSAYLELHAILNAAGEDGQPGMAPATCLASSRTDGPPRLD